MTARRALLLIVLLAAASVSAWGQLTISPATLPIGGGVFLLNQMIPTQLLTANNLPSDIVQWSVSSGNLPPGLNLDPIKGGITGTPTQAGAFTFTVEVLDESVSQTGFRQYTLYVASCLPLALTAVTHTPAAAGSAYVGDTFQASCGVPGYSWALQSGTNADGLTMVSSSSLLSGIPLTGGIFPIGVVVTDASGAQASGSFSLSVLGVGTSSLPDGALGVAYSQAIAVSGATGPVTWALGGKTTLPPGLNISTEGLITGTPTAGGTYSFQVVVTDTVSKLSASMTLSINIPLSLTITTTSLPNGTLGTIYPTQTLAATGGSGTLSWTLLSGTPPTGLGLSAQGQITGTPTAAGPFSFQVQVTDSVTHLTANKTLTITIAAAITISPVSLPGGFTSVPYSITLSVVGSSASFTWAVTAGTLPVGLTLGATTGIISGIPTVAGSPTFTVTATAGSAPVFVAPVVQQLSIDISAIGINPTTLPNGSVGIPYSATLSLPNFGTPAAVSWEIVPGSGNLPANLTLNPATGVISGTPAAAGTWPFVVSATATLGAVTGPPITKAFTLVTAALPSVTISGLSATEPPAVQPAATVSLTGGTYPLNITGTMTLTFAPAAGGSQLYDEMFANGSGTTATFTIPAGATGGLFGTASSVPVMVGTVGGTITISTTLQDSAGNTLPALAPIVIAVNSTVPVIKGVTIGTVTTSGFSISVTGFSSTRDMTNAVFAFTSPTNATLSSSSVTVALTSPFTTWYSSAASDPFGSQFTMTVQFTFTGPAGTTVPFTTVTVTMTNSKGASNAFGPTSP